MRLIFFQFFNFADTMRHQRKYFYAIHLPLKIYPWRAEPMPLNSNCRRRSPPLHSRIPNSVTENPLWNTLSITPDVVPNYFYFIETRFRKLRVKVCSSWKLWECGRTWKEKGDIGHDEMLGTMRCNVSESLDILPDVKVFLGIFVLQ